MRQLIDWLFCLYANECSLSLCIFYHLCIVTRSLLIQLFAALLEFKKTPADTPSWFVCHELTHAVPFTLQSTRVWPFWERWSNTGWPFQKQINVDVTLAEPLLEGECAATKKWDVHFMFWPFHKGIWSALLLQNPRKNISTCAPALRLTQPLFLQPVNEVYTLWKGCVWLAGLQWLRMFTVNGILWVSEWAFVHLLNNPTHQR